MAISFLPFPTSLLGEYSGEQLSVAIYAANAATASLLLVSISLVGDLGAPPRGPRLGRRRGGEAPAQQALAVPAVFLLSIGISFFSPTAAMYSWLLLTITDPIIRRVGSRP